MKNSVQIEESTVEDIGISEFVPIPVITLGVRPCYCLDDLSISQNYTIFESEISVILIMFHSNGRLISMDLLNFPYGMPARGVRRLLTFVILLSQVE